MNNSGGSDSGRGSGGDTRHWKAEGTEVTVNAFSGFIGPTIPVGEPLDLFLALFTPQLLDQIVTETNHYASDCLSASHDGNGLPPQWQTNAEEVKAYFGICILMGINKLPHLYDYWSMNEYLHYFPVASKIPRKRFLEIHRYLHFTRNDTIVPRGQPGHDRLAKVRPVLSAVRQSFISSYHPHRENSIDEAMVKFKGRSSLKQYMPKKPTKRGFKIWVRSDSTNGFISDFEVYTGKGEGGSTETGLGSKVVKK